MSNALPNIVLRLLVGLALSSAIGWVAFRRGSLSRSGVLGAIITGTVIFGFGGWVAGLLLIAFFVSSSALSHFKRGSAQKAHAAEAFEKGGRRDLWQAMANGSVAAGCAIVLGIAELTAQHGLGLAATGAFLGALATVNADTWATELGVLSRVAPRMITNWRKTVPPGTSGGITLVGTSAALAGALFIGVCDVALSGLAGRALRVDSVVITLFVCTVAGAFGSLFDSVLGATVQAMYFDPSKNRETERAIGRPIRGWRWLNNDWVNFISSLAGAILGAAIYGLRFSIYD